MSAGMENPEVERIFAEAGRAGKLAWLVEPNGRYRVVQPYMIYESSTGKRLFHFFQVGGYSAGGILRGWKNPEVGVFSEARVVDERYSPREDYNPFNVEMFPHVLFAVPTLDGRQRETD